MNACIPDVLISKVALKRAFNQAGFDLEDHYWEERGFTEATVERLIDEAPAAEAAPLIHAAWLSNGEFAMCSHCHELFKEREVTVFRYCPECGAQVNGGDINDRA